tara:strand:+ start:725 stop:940 length:216 start_codon:yes stop_codon:yes gene_type:complete
MATIKNVRQIMMPEHGGQVEIVYDVGDCKYIMPTDSDYAEVQSWIDNGNTVVGYSTNAISTPKFIIQSRAT